jgi:DNA-binding NarL/FixJ family response regulator
MRIRILIADDNANVRSAVSRMIRNAGEDWEVCYEAVDGQAAVEKAAELRPDLLILDLLMPYDGISAGRKIRELLPSAPMVLNTIWSSPALELEARNAGFQVVAEKSSSRGLISAIHQALANSSLLAQPQGIKPKRDF